MIVPRLTYALTLTLPALFGWAEPCGARALDPTPAPDLVAAPSRFGWVGLDPSRQTDSFLSPRDTSPLDDEVEVPDEEEDEEPDDLGQALDPEGRSVPLPADVGASNLGRIAPPARPPLTEGASSGQDRPRFLSLCRFLC
jgi:hypothetical protein